MSTATSPGVIDAQAVYTRDEIMRRLRWQRAAWRAAVADGLPVHRRGRQAFVIGREFVEWLATTHK